ncbi:hypothetical protein PSHT_06011 [Puccinia striiformis]|uniref:Uncharacterized protein n=1 Tax=Puccinia striiformis TaxID=27350 RepID=A0A2S4W920_9BASI|nr:hypothetical protein PSHT_06011 [Puccinia striiformis]
MGTNSRPNNLRITIPLLHLRSWKIQTEVGMVRQTLGKRSLLARGSRDDILSHDGHLPTPTEQMHPSHHSFSSLFSWGSTAYPPKLVTPFEATLPRLFLSILPMSLMALGLEAMLVVHLPRYSNPSRNTREIIHTLHTHICTKIC